jgi:prepilin-type N-terminal cleavage/methylation domain-containing protein/prepilin-type processing-associated H-X9-DG protein
MRHVTRGYTLVELLIVIAIIVLLVAILLPALSVAREHAKRVKCMSNVRQLTAAWLTYANDNRGHFCSSEMQHVIPGQTSGFTDYALAGVTTPPNFFWSWIGAGAANQDIPRGVLWPYLKNLQVYYCPNDPVLPDTVYAINGLLAGRVGVPRTLFTLGQLRHAERIFVFIEAGPDASDSGSGGNCAAPNDRVPTAVQVRPGASFATPFCPAMTFGQLPGTYHSIGAANGTPVAFADGHVVFWEYTSPSGIADTQGSLATATSNSADVVQLEAWSGGPTPPGSNP